VLAGGSGGSGGRCRREAAAGSSERRGVRCQRVVAREEA
jgi:hypothetical protein